jgi:gliding motility-associated protein GldL
MKLSINKTQMNFAYGMGAAVVIIGALMKITHTDLDLFIFEITGNTMLTIGLVTEAIIFAISAFDKPGKEYEWEKAFPELAGGKARVTSSGGGGVTIEDVQDMIKKAKLDQEVFTKLTNSIKDFETSTKQGADSLSSSIKDFEASAKSGADNASELVKINKEFAENANQLNQQMQSLASNLESLNDVYGGVLSAMNKK